MKISIIVVIANKNAIGKDNKLLCHLPNDLKWFKKNTLNHNIIMGRNTFLSLPKGALPKRINIVLTDKPDDNFENCIMAHSIEEAKKHFDKEKENFIIGGASIYKQFLPMANKLYLTRIKHDFDADAFFPEINFDDWKLIHKIDNNIDEKNKYKHSFLIYENIRLQKK